MLDVVDCSGLGGDSDDADIFVFVLVERALRAGISCRQGGHPVAKKSSTTTLPFSSSDDIPRPTTGLSLKAGAGGSGEACGLRAGSARNNPVSIVTTIETVRIIIGRFLLILYTRRVERPLRIPILQIVGQPARPAYNEKCRM